MKAVMMSIQPKWCELIANGKKTVEVRNTRPKLETPFKCYIYETKTPLRWDKAHNNIIGGDGGCIIGEFVCDGIIRHCEMANADIAVQQGKIDRKLLYLYSASNELFGWHISDLIIYDEPKDLSEFYRLGKPLICDGRNCENCNHLKYMQVNSDEWNYDCDCQHQLENRITLKRPPQSWCYVEEAK